METTMMLVVGLVAGAILTFILLDIFLG